MLIRAIQQGLIAAVLALSALSAAAQAPVPTTTAERPELSTVVE